MNSSIYVVIMAGGVGSRFWPYSRTSRPKQFIDVLGTGKSLLQLTFDRFTKIAPNENILIVTNEQYKDLVAEQLPDINSDQILCEPHRRNTGPCIAYASYKIREKDPNGVMIVSPADHAIFNEERFIQILSAATDSAKSDDKLITIGITPNRPETGYGYIQYISGNDDDPVKKVKTFTEKPELELAQKFIESGDFVWNAGIFVWSVSSILKGIEECLPDVAEIFELGKNDYFTEREQEFIDKAYSQTRNISIDYGVMEKADNVYVVMGDFDWSDLGSWNSLHEIRDKDSNDNVIESDNVLTFDCNNNYIKSDTGRLLVLHNLQGCLVADFDDVLMVCNKDEEAKFREFVAEVKSKKGEEYL